MGWASGSELMSEVITIVNDMIDDDCIRTELYIKLINVFENYDCDTLNECCGNDEAYDKAYNEVYPDEEYEEYEEWEEE